MFQARKRVPGLLAQDEEKCEHVNIEEFQARKRVPGLLALQTRGAS